MQACAADEGPVNSEVKAARADPAPGSVSLLENSHSHVEEEGTGRDADGARSGLILRRSRNSVILLPRWLTPTAMMPSAHAAYPCMHAAI